MNFILFIELSGAVNDRCYDLQATVSHLPGRLPSFGYRKVNWRLSSFALLW